MSRFVSLGVNIDHIATIRNARGSLYPNMLRACQIVADNANLITIHLREDRRHITDADLELICKKRPCPVNLEIGLNWQITQIAIAAKPDFVCIVPEKREEVTTESGLNIALQSVFDKLVDMVPQFTSAGISVSLFLDPSDANIQIIKTLLQTGCKIAAVEVHTGKYSHLCDLNKDAEVNEEIAKITSFAAKLTNLGIKVNAGHGLTFNNVGKIAAIDYVSELNIGHFLITEAIFTGLEGAIKTMRNIIDKHTNVNGNKGR